MTAPRPGRRVRGSRSGRPLMAALDLLGRRWALRVLWELRGEPQSFRGLQERSGGLSPSVLNARLGELREAGLVTQDDSGYRLTPVGHGLGRALDSLEDWAQRWAREA